MAYFSQEELDAFRAQGLPGVGQRPQKPKKGFWQDQISTGGGIAGSLAGGAAGAAIGSAVPGIGTAIGGLAGAILGGFGGGAGGQAVENVVTNEDDLNKDILKEGLLNGAFALGPIRGANIAIQGSKAIAGGTGVRSAIEQGITATPIRSAISNKLGTKATEAGTNLLGSQANLTRAETRKLGPGGAPADVLGGINKDFGLRSMDDMAAVGANVTGKNGILSELTRNAVGNSPGVDFGDLRHLTNDLLINQAPLLSNAQRKNILEQVQNSVVKTYGGSKGSLSTLANPLDAFDVAKSFEKMAAKIRTSPTVSPTDEQLASVYTALAKNMTDRLFNAPGVTDGVQLARKEAFDKFMNLAATATNKQQRTAYQKLAQQASGLEDVASIRSAQAPFVKLSKIDEATARAQSGAGAQFGDQMQGLGRFVQKPTNLLAVPLNAATSKVGGALTKAGRGLSGIQANGGVNPLGNAARVGAGGGLVSALTGDYSNPQPENNIQDQLSMQDPSSVDPSLMETPQPTNPFGVSQEEVAAQMMIALQKGDSKGFGQLKDIYDMIGEFESAGMDGGEMSAAAQKATIQAANGENAVNQLEQLLTQAGGGSGSIGGRVKGFLGSVDLDQNAKLYNDSLGGYVDMIAKARGKTDALSEADRELILNSLPKITDTPDQVRQKIMRLRQDMQLARQNAMKYGGRSSSLEDALSAY